MVQSLDYYLFKRKYICGLPHLLIKSICEVYRISTEHSTIEEILKEVQHMETAQRAISLLMKHSNNPGGKSSQANPICKTRRAKKGPHPTKGKDPSTLKRVTPFIINNQGSKGPAKGMTKGVEMKSKRENNRAGSLRRKIHFRKSSMAFIALNCKQEGHMADQCPNRIDGSRPTIRSYLFTVKAQDSQNGIPVEEEVEQ